MTLSRTQQAAEQKRPKRNIRVRLARDQKEISASQNLRYKVFYEEYGAVPSEEMKALERDFDAYDPHADHLIVTDIIDNKETIVGTYRFLKRDGAKACGGFYSEGEYDLSPLLSQDIRLLELGRSCVMPNYRAGSVLQLLWQGIADYIADHKIDVMFGCASMHSTDIGELAPALSYMHHYHRAPEDMCPRAVDGRYIGMNILEKEGLDVKAIFSDLPPLLKGYLRVGAQIGDGAVIDPQFNTTDVCIVAQTKLVTQRYRRHYERKIDKEIEGAKSSQDESDVGVVNDNIDKV